MKRKSVEFVHEGKYAAEVPVELIEGEGGWSPYLTMEDARKLEAVRLALRRVMCRPLPSTGVCSSCYRSQHEHGDAAVVIK